MLWKPPVSGWTRFPRIHRVWKFLRNGVTGPDEYNTLVTNKRIYQPDGSRNHRYAVHTNRLCSHQNPPNLMSCLVRQDGTRALRTDGMGFVTCGRMYVPYYERLKKRDSYRQDDSFLTRSLLTSETRQAIAIPCCLFTLSLNSTESRVSNRSGRGPGHVSCWGIRVLRRRRNATSSFTIPYPGDSSCFVRH